MSNDTRRGDVSGLPRIIGVPVIKKKKPASPFGRPAQERRNGFLVSELESALTSPAIRLPDRNRQKTSAEWARERAERERENGTGPRSVTLRASQMPGGENSPEAIVSNMVERKASGEPEPILTAAEITAEKEAVRALERTMRDAAREEEREAAREMLDDKPSPRRRKKK